MATLRTGDSLDKCTDVSSLVSEAQWDKVDGFVRQGRLEGASVHQAEVPGRAGLRYPPTLVTGVQSTSALVRPPAPLHLMPHSQKPTCHALFARLQTFHHPNFTRIFSLQKLAKH